MSENKAKLAFQGHNKNSISPWTPDLAKALSAYKSVDRVNAFIMYEGQCGFFGSRAYVVNSLNNTQVAATVRVTHTYGFESQSYDTVITIPAGSRVLLGCTAGAGPSDGNYSYEVVGTVP